MSKSNDRTLNSGVDKFVKFADDPRIEKSMPHKQFEYVDAYFPAANVDTLVPYTILRPEFPTDVRWIDVKGGSVFDATKVAHVQGRYTNVAYSAANFSAAGGGSWTVDSGDQNTYKYLIDRDQMTVDFGLVGTDITGVVLAALIAVPAGFQAVGRAVGQVIINDAGAGVVGNCAVNVGQPATVIAVTKIGAAAFTVTAADNTNITGSITFQITPSTVSDEPAEVYVSALPSAMKHGEGYLVLRSTVAGYRTRLQLFIER